MTALKEKTIYFITGASGVGKTTLVNQLKKEYENKPWVFFTLTPLEFRLWKK